MSQSWAMRPKSSAAWPSISPSRSAWDRPCSLNSSPAEPSSDRAWSVAECTTETASSLAVAAAVPACSLTACAVLHGAFFVARRRAGGRRRSGGRAHRHGSLLVGSVAWFGAAGAVPAGAYPSSRCTEQKAWRAGHPLPRVRASHVLRLVRHTRFLRLPRSRPAGRSRGARQRQAGHSRRHRGRTGLPRRRTARRRRLRPHVGRGAGRGTARRTSGARVARPARRGAARRRVSGVDRCRCDVGRRDAGRPRSSGSTTRRSIAIDGVLPVLASDDDPEMGGRVGRLVEPGVDEDVLGLDDERDSVALAFPGDDLSAEEAAIHLTDEPPMGPGGEGS